MRNDERKKTCFLIHHSSLRIPHSIMIRRPRPRGSALGPARGGRGGLPILLQKNSACASRFFVLECPSTRTVAVRVRWFLYLSSSNVHENKTSRSSDRGF